MTEPATSARDPGAARRRRTQGSNGAVAETTAADAPSTAVVLPRPSKRGPKPVGPRRAPARRSPEAASAASDIDTLGRTLLETIRAHYPQAKLDPIERAFALAVEAHATQRRA